MSGHSRPQKSSVSVGFAEADTDLLREPYEGYSQQQSSYDEQETGAIGIFQAHKFADEQIGEE